MSPSASTAEDEAEVSEEALEEVVRLLKVIAGSLRRIEGFIGGLKIPGWLRK
jgi:hypothetical protein